MRLDELLALMPTLTPGERRLVENAYHFAEEAHRPYRRKSGEPFFVHVAAVAGILASIEMDTSTVVAGLLHDVVEDTSVTLTDIRERFGDDVAHLVDGVTKIEGATSEADYLRKTIYAMREDVRVIIIKLADRLHNMRTLGSLKPQRQVEIAEETMQLFAPLATRLGMWQMKTELEDLSFRYLDPPNYRAVTQSLQDNSQALQQFFDGIMKRLEESVKAQGISAFIRERPHSVYHIFKEMQRRTISAQETLQVRGVRVVVDDLVTCYTMLGLVHQLWRPVPSGFVDYIGAPKDSYYQSLHTTIYHESGNPFQIQIRTRSMDNRAENGIAAYWQQYRGNRELFQAQIEEPMKHLRRLIDPARTADTAEGFIRSVIEDIDNDRIYAYTPRGDTIDLPRGATPIDFAYHIHTEVGHRCRGARVHGRLVPLDYKLQTGDHVEIYTSNRGGPSLDWLDESLGYVHTNRARNSIRNWFKRGSQTELIQAGREALDRKFRQLGLHSGNYEELLSRTEYQNVDEMLEAIGRGKQGIIDLVAYSLDSGRKSYIPGNQIILPPIVGARGYRVKLARCCKPKPGDAVLGYVTREAKVSVHRKDCPALLSKREISDRLIAVSWGMIAKPNAFRVPVQIQTFDRAGMMGDIGQVVAGEDINLSDVHITSNAGYATFQLAMELDSYATLSRVLTKIESLEGVIQAQRQINPEDENEAEAYALS